MNINLDQLNHFDMPRSIKSAFALVDKLQERDRDTQLPAVMLLAYTLMLTADLRPGLLYDIGTKVREDAKRRQQPEVEGLIRYFREELIKGAP